MKTPRALFCFFFFSSIFLSLSVFSHVEHMADKLLVIKPPGLFQPSRQQSSDPVELTAQAQEVKNEIDEVVRLLRSKNIIVAVLDSFRKNTTYQSSTPLVPLCPSHWFSTHYLQGGSKTRDKNILVIYSFPSSTDSRINERSEEGLVSFMNNALTVDNPAPNYHRRDRLNIVFDGRLSIKTSEIADHHAVVMPGPLMDRRRNRAYFVVLSSLSPQERQQIKDSSIYFFHHTGIEPVLVNLNDFKEAEIQSDGKIRSLDPVQDRIYSNDVMAALEYIGIICSSCIKSEEQRLIVINKLERERYLWVSQEQVKSHCTHLVEVRQGRSDKYFTIMSQTAFDAFTLEQKKIFEEAGGELLVVSIPVLESLGVSLSCLLTPIFADLYPEEVPWNHIPVL